MRKHRKWWMGFGIGIVVGATLLQVVSFADKYGAEQPKTYTQQQLDDAVKEAVEQAASSQPSSGSESPVPADGNPSSEPPESPSSEPSAESSPSPDAGGIGEDRVVAFYVYPGMNLTNVARSLYALELIEDRDDFMTEARKIQHKLEVGTNEFRGKPTYKEIIAELTRKKD